jgi:hypothetical protein
MFVEVVRDAVRRQHGIAELVAGDGLIQQRMVGMQRAAEGEAQAQLGRVVLHTAHPVACAGVLLLQPVAGVAERPGVADVEGRRVLHDQLALAHLGAALPLRHAATHELLALAVRVALPLAEPGCSSSDLLSVLPLPVQLTSGVVDRCELLEGACEADVEAAGSLCAAVHRGVVVLAAAVPARADANALAAAAARVLQGMEMARPGEGGRHAACLLGHRHAAPAGHADLRTLCVSRVEVQIAACRLPVPAVRLLRAAVMELHEGARRDVGGRADGLIRVVQRGDGTERGRRLRMPLDVA